jgi:hypothetical protein
MTPAQIKLGIAHWSGEARRLHLLADDFQRDCDLQEANTYRRAALRAQRFADEFRKFQPPSPAQHRAERGEGGGHAQIPEP